MAITTITILPSDTFKNSHSTTFEVSFHIKFEPYAI